MFKRSNPKTKTHPGLTLIEVVVSMTILGLLSLAALSLTASASRTLNLTRERLKQNKPKLGQALIPLLTHDLNNATRVQTSAGEFKLSGCLWIDPTTFEPTNRPALVEYKLTPTLFPKTPKDIDIPLNLVRIQTKLFAHDNSNPSFTMLIVTKVRKFRVSPVSLTLAAQDDSTYLPANKYVIDLVTTQSPENFTITRH